MKNEDGLRQFYNEVVDNGDMKLLPFNKLSDNQKKAVHKVMISIGWAARKREIGLIGRIWSKAQRNPKLYVRAVLLITALIVFAWYITTSYF